MYGTNRPPFVDASPFGLPADSVEITLDLPMPTSTNKIWRAGRGHVYRSKEYIAWQEHADMTVMASKQYPKRKLCGPYEMKLLLSIEHGGDGSNRIKALEDWLQSRDIIRNDSDCRRGSWAWVSPEEAPKGCRVILRSLHGQCE